MIAEVEEVTGEVRMHVWGADLSGSLQGAGGVGGLLMTFIINGPNAGVYFPVYDGNGNVMGYVRGADGLLVVQYEYGPFGELLRATGPLSQTFNYLFSTKPLDWEIGLLYYGHRYYNPTTGRWPSRDPLGEKGGINLYEFVRNNPILKVDPDGRNPIIIGGGIIVVGGGGAYVGLCINRWACRRYRDLTLGLGEAQANANAPDGSTHRGAGATPGNDADMLTHCITSCDLARHPGPCGSPDRALDFMQERETGNDAATQIDRLNNEVGFGVGISSQRQGQTCTAACLAALNRGLLYTIRNGAPASSPPRR
ncbi:MAG: RHS repeat-associated core domain-containing protein [Verrucomicrobiae bacterium]|nr:RHS repeat-associated core domain-containing protein [Verrucomicrobiae bacterium]